MKLFQRKKTNQKQSTSSAKESHDQNWQTDESEGLLEPIAIEGGDEKADEKCDGKKNAQRCFDQAPLMQDEHAPNR